MEPGAKGASFVSILIPKGREEGKCRLNKSFFEKRLRRTQIFLTKNYDIILINISQNQFNNLIYLYFEFL